MGHAEDWLDQKSKINDKEASAFPIGMAAGKDFMES